MDAKFSQRIKDVLSYSKEEAVRLGNAYIGTEHLFLGILREGEGLAINILEGLNINLIDLKKAIEHRIRSEENFKLTDTENIPLFYLKLTGAKSLPAWSGIQQTAGFRGHLKDFFEPP